MTEVENETRSVVDALYEAYLAGDSEGMLAQMADDVEVRFLAPGGVPAVRRFMQFSAGLLHHLDFRIRRTIVDGDAAAVIWDESATTAAGKPRENHGVDVIPSPERQNRRAPREQRHQSRLSAIPTIRPGSCERMMPRSREGDDLEGASPIGAMTDEGIRTP